MVRDEMLGFPNVPVNVVGNAWKIRCIEGAQLVVNLGCEDTLMAQPGQRLVESTDSRKEIYEAHDWR